MTRILIVASTLALVTAGTAARSEDAFVLGVLGGASFTRVDWSPQPDFDVSSRTRPTGGVFAGYRFGDRLALETRVLRVEKAVDLGASLQGDGSGAATIRYVAVPVLVKVHLGGKALRPFLLAGPELDLRTSAESWRLLGGRRWDEPEFEDEVDTKDFALDVGAGVEIPAGRFDVILEGLYSHGVINVAAPGETDDVKTRTLRVSTGLRF